MDRNTVIVDGQNKPGNGIEIFKTNDVSVNNLTVENFDTGSRNAGRLRQRDLVERRLPTPAKSARTAGSGPT